MEKKFTIPETMNNVVKKLILNTDSMNDEERQYWFDIWDLMDESQQIILQNILQTEKDKLDDLDKRYQEEINKLSSPFLKD